MNLSLHDNKISKQDLFFLLIFFCLFYFIFLGTRPLLVPDEGRYAEIAREMATTGNFLTPHLNGVIYLEKPPLYYWMVASTVKLLGQSEWIYRLWTCVLGILGCLMTYITATKLFDRKTGWLSSLIASTAFLYYAMSHDLTLDMPLSFFLSMSLMCFLLGLNHTGRHRDYLLWLAYFFSGFAVMTKGLIGLVFPIMIIGLWVLILNQWRELKSMRIISGLFIILLVNLPWLLWMEKLHPGFLHFYLIDQQFARYSTDIAKRHMSLSAYFGVVILAFSPWIIFIFNTVKHHLPRSWQDRKAHSNALFLMIWAFSIILFFSFSKSVLIPYVLPMTLPLAILTGHYFRAHWHNKLTTSNYVSILLMILILVGVTVTLIILPYLRPVSEPVLAKTYFYLMSAICLIGAIGLIFGLFKKWPLSDHFKTIFITFLLVFPLFIAAFGHLDDRTIKPLAQILNKELAKHPKAEIASVGTYHQDMPVYANRTVTIVDWINELEFGLSHQPQAKHWIINKDTFFKRWSSDKKMYAIVRQSDYKYWPEEYKKKSHTLAENEENRLVENQTALNKENP